MTSSFSPREIVSELDRFIVGQHDAKRAVAIALRNRWRRQQLEPEGGIIAIGSGGNYALAAARALIDVEGMDAEAIARKAMDIAADICVYTNHNLVIEKL